MGAQGSQGVQGTQGTTGSQGAIGAQGAVGAQGSQGVQGLSNQGVQGTQGRLGAQGVQGVQGLSNQGVQGSQGVQGRLGAQGSQGVQGLSNQGVQGSQGAVLLGIPQSTNTTLVASDAGKHINTTGTVTVNSSTAFGTGDMVTIYNNSASTVGINTSAVTLRFAGTSAVGNRFLSQRGLANILCVASNDYVISGAGLT